jgi:hypothetical protein
VGLTDAQACYQLLAGDAVSVWHYNEELHLAGDTAECRSLPSRPNLPRPHQPPGREPVRRRAG